MSRLTQIKLVLLIFGHGSPRDYIAVWGLSHFSGIGSGRGGGVFLLLTYFRVAKRRLGSAEAPKTNKCPGAKPLPGKLPKGQ